MGRNTPPEKRCPGCGCYKPVDERLPEDVVCFDGPGAFDQGDDMSWLFPKLDQDWESDDDIVDWVIEHMAWDDFDGQEIEIKSPPRHFIRLSEAAWASGIVDIPETLC